MGRKRLGEILIGAGVLSEDQLRGALREQQKWGGPLGRILVRDQLVSEQVIVRALAKQLNLPVVDLSTLDIPEEVLDLVPGEVAEQHKVVPFRVENKFLDVAMADPMNMGIIDELRIRTRLNVRPYICELSIIERAIRDFYTHEMDIDVSHDPMALRGDILHGRSDPASDMREAEITSLQKRLSALEALVTRDENVIRKLLGLLVQKGVATREEILEAIK